MLLKTYNRQPTVARRYETEKAGRLVAIATLGWILLSSGGPDALAVKPQVAAGAKHTVGVKSDSTIVASGENLYVECDVNGWTEIVLVAACFGLALCLKPGGTVVYIGYFGQSDVT